MSIPKFLSTLFNWSFVYKLVVNESLVEVDKSSSQMSLKVGKNSPVDENYLFPFHFWTKISPAPLNILPQLLLIFSNKIEIKELKKLKEIKT